MVVKRNVIMGLLLILLIVICFSMEKRFMGMGRPEDLRFLIPDVSDLHYITALEQREGFGLGLGYEEGKSHFIGGIEAANIGLSLDVESETGYEDIYTIGLGILLHPFCVGMGVTSHDTMSDLKLELGLAEESDLLLVGAVSFEGLPSYENPQFFEEVQKRIETEKYVREVVGRAILGDALLISGKYLWDGVNNEERGAVMVGFIVPIRHVSKIRVSRYFYRTRVDTYPTLVGFVYSFKGVPEDYQNREERIGLVAEGVALPFLTVRMGLWTQKYDEDTYGSLEQYVGVGLVLSNLRIDLHLAPGTDLYSTKWGMEVTLDSLK